MDIRERNKRRVYAQNFLIDTRIAERIVDVARLTPQDVVLEIGPGSGALTNLLSSKSAHVIAIEKDPMEAHKLLTSLKTKNVSLVQADITTYEYLQHFKKADDGISDFIVVSNLPYNAGTHILQMLVTARIRPKRIVVMLQKEVAARVCAKPGDLSMLGLVCQWFAETKELFEVPPEAFQPKPNVTSEVIQLLPKKNSALRVPYGDEKEIFRIAKMGFSSKRKKLSNNLSAGLQVPRETVENFFLQMGLPATARAEELSLQNWLHVAKKITEYLHQ